jgi:hypothetical protein
MRRLLAPIVTIALLLGSAAPASASNRVPKGITKVSVSLTFPTNFPSSEKPVRRTLTKASTVAEVVDATNALPVAVYRGDCPMVMRLGPELTVSFRNAGGTAVAQVLTQVTTGSRGGDGTSPCFPIHFTSKGKTASLLGNSWIRMMGRLIGRTIS